MTSNKQSESSKVSPNRPILIVDDDAGFLKLIEKSLTIEGSTNIIAHDGYEALQKFESHQPRLVIVDLFMPVLDGLAVIKHIRSNSTVPIIVLTGRGQEALMVEAFELGADDYIHKPFSLIELQMRVEALLRRQRWDQHQPPVHRVRFGRNEINLAQQRVTRSGELVVLSSLEYRLLSVLVSHPGRIFTHLMLLQQVWGDTYEDEVHYVRIYIGRLRQKLEDTPAKPVHILTYPNVGYYFEP